MNDLTKTFSEKVHARVAEILGTDVEPFLIAGLTFGTDPNVTEEQQIEEVSKSLARFIQENPPEVLARDLDRFKFFHPDQGKPELPDDCEGKADITPLPRLIAANNIGNVIVRHAKSDIEYIDGLAAHMESGGEPSSKNISDLIAMVRWNAEMLISYAKEEPADG